MIFYFSATGNSKYAALKLARLTGDRVFNIADAFKNGIPELAKGETTGFVFPVFYSGIPEIVMRFARLERVRAAMGDYVYCVITCGGENSAAADKMLAKALDCEIDYSVSLSMPDNYVVIYNPSGKERCLEKIKSADSELEKIAEEIKGRELKKGSNFVGSVMTEIMYPLYGLFRKTAKFHADDNCISCGKCVTLCPDGIISLSGGKPKWNSAKCQHCTACINRCPQRAIQYGKGTSSRRRYSIENAIK